MEGMNKRHLHIRFKPGLDRNIGDPLTETPRTLPGDCLEQAATCRARAPGGRSGPKSETGKMPTGRETAMLAGLFSYRCLIAIRLVVVLPVRRLEHSWVATSYPGFGAWLFRPACSFLQFPSASSLGDQSGAVPAKMTTGNPANAG